MIVSIKDINYCEWRMPIILMKLYPIKSWETIFDIHYEYKFECSIIFYKIYFVKFQRDDMWFVVDLNVVTGNMELEIFHTQSNLYPAVQG